MLTNFEEVFEDVTKSFIKIDTDQYLEKGTYPVIDQGEKPIAGFTDLDLSKCDIKPPFIVFGDHTRRFKYIDFDCCLGADGAKVLKPKIDADVKFLFYALKNTQLENNGYSRHYKFLKRKSIYLPPLAEQQRIAAILDKAELVKHKRELVIEKLDELAQSVFIEMFGHPISNYHGHSIKTLKELGNVKTGGTPPSALDNMFGGYIPFITPGDLNSGVDVRRHLTPDGASQSVVVKKGSALVCCIGATIGKMAKANSECAFNQQINAIEWGDEVDDDYGIFALTLMKPIIISSATSTTLPILNKTSFEKIKFPVPPIEKQAIFSKTVKKLEQLKAIILSSKNLAINSIASLQSQAFSGQL
jgi:type I restriction enzyme S subunit